MHDDADVIHRRVFHRRASNQMAAAALATHTDRMTNHSSQQAWISHLDTNTAAPEATGDLATVFQRLALAWHATAAVARPASPATEHAWLRLAEALLEAWSDLASTAPAPGPIGINVGQPDQPMPDTPQARQAVARLARRTAADLRARPAAQADAALTLASVADTLEGAVEDWP